MLGKSQKKPQTVKDAWGALTEAIAAHPDSGKKKWVEFGEKVEKKGMSSQHATQFRMPPRNPGLSSLGLTTTEGRQLVDEKLGQLKTAHTLQQHKEHEQELALAHNAKGKVKREEEEEKANEAARRLTAEGIAETKAADVQQEEVQERERTRNMKNQALFAQAVDKRQKEEKESGVVVGAQGSYGKYGGKTKRRRRNKRKGTKRKGTKRRKSKHRTRRRKGNQKKRTRKRR
jgi:hypothetical protein